MKLTKEPYRGTRDFFPKDKRVRDYIFSIMTKNSELFGYESYDGPLLEEVELYKAKSGEELINDQIYSFTDRGERFVAIRPEMTPTLARMIAKVHRDTPKPIRWFSIPNLMRYEKPQRGRVREHWQLNVDIFGAPGRLGELEILQVVIELFTKLGADKTQFEILINDRAIVDSVFSGLMKADESQIYRLYKILDKAKKVNEEAIKKMVSELKLDSNSENIFYAYLQCDTFSKLIDFLSKNNQNDVSEKFNQFVEATKSANIFDFLTFDPTIVRGLDYYTGVVFEVFDKHPDNRRALCGGGSYANLLQIFDEEPLAGVGFGLGDVTLRDFLETHHLLPNFDTPINNIALTFSDDQALEKIVHLAAQLRAENIKVVSGLESMNFKKVFPFAEKRGAKFIGIIGSNELAQNQIQIKNMQTKEQFICSIVDITAIVKIIKD